MSKPNESEFHELEPLEELPEHAPLEELEPLPDDAAAKPSSQARKSTNGGGASRSGAPASAATQAAAADGPELAPLMLQKAALILTFATLLPWLVPEGFNLIRLGAKVVVLIGGWALYCAVEHEHGGKTPLDGIGKSHKLALPILGYVLILVGILLTMAAGQWQGMIEAAGLSVGVISWCQVHGYVRGGKFNPMMALVIPMFGLAALLNIAVVLTLEVDGLSKALAILGSLGVAGAGGFGGYTMFVAMKEAKAHGEAKKRAAVEARAAERKRKRESGA